MEFFQHPTLFHKLEHTVGDFRVFPFFRQKRSYLFEARLSHHEPKISANNLSLTIRGIAASCVCIRFI